RKTAPCIWPLSPTAAICLGPTLPSANSSRQAATKASHHLAGSCSAQPGRGMLILMGALASATAAPPASTTCSLRTDVPRSMPRYIGSVFLLGITGLTDVTEDRTGQLCRAETPDPCAPVRPTYRAASATCGWPPP